MNLLEHILKRFHIKTRSTRFYEHLMESAYQENTIPGLVHWVDDQYKIFNM